MVIKRCLWSENMFQLQPLKKYGKPRALVVEDPKRYGPVR